MSIYRDNASVSLADAARDLDGLRARVKDSELAIDFDDVRAAKSIVVHLMEAYADLASHINAEHDSKAEAP